MSSELKKVPLSEIMLDCGTQARVETSQAWIDELQQVLHENGELDPVHCFTDGTTYWMADGFQRLAAYQAEGYVDMPCHVHDGTVRDAILYAVGANARHGLQRTPADKRRAVEILLGDDEWSGWSTNAIAERCHVSWSLVAEIQGERAKRQPTLPAGDESTTPPEQSVTYQNRHGHTGSMKTGNIGKKPTGKTTTQDVQGPVTSRARSDSPQDENLISGYPCDSCDLAFTRPHWHCEKCRAHWLPEVPKCRDCGSSRPCPAEWYEDIEPSLVKAIESSGIKGPIPVAKPAKSSTDHFEEIEVAIGRIVRLVDDLASSDKGSNRFAEAMRKSMQQGKHSLEAWKKSGTSSVRNAG